MTNKKLNELGIDMNGVRVPMLQLFSENYAGQFDGLSEITCKRIKIIREIITEYNRSKDYTNKTITCSHDASEVLIDYFKGLRHEEVVVLYLNNANQIIRRIPLTVGDADSAIIDNKRIVRTAIELSASGIILSHNHPSQNPEPSTPDIKQTESLKNACDIVGISLLDHIICTDSKFYSFAEEKTHRYRK